MPQGVLDQVGFYHSIMKTQKPEESKIMRSATVLLISLALFFGACQSPTEPEPDLSQDLGVVLTEPIMWYTKFVWSPNSREIFYLSSSPGQLCAVDVTKKVTRVVNQTGSPYGTSADGKYLYYSANAGLYRLTVNGENTERLVNNISSIHTGDLQLPALALSPDNIHLAYMAARNSGDSLFLYNTSIRWQKFYTHGQPVCFSPDGNRLLLRRRGQTLNDTLYVLTFGDGSVQTIAVISMGHRNIRWTGDGIQLLRYQSGACVIQNIPSNAITTLYINDGYSLFGGMTWSATGNKFAVWSHECIKDQGWSSCGAVGYRLHLTELNASRSHLIAHGNVPGNDTGAGNVLAFLRTTRKLLICSASEYM